MTDDKEQGESPKDSGANEGPGTESAGTENAGAENADSKGEPSSSPSQELADLIDSAKDKAKKRAGIQVDRSAKVPTVLRTRNLLEALRRLTQVRAGKVALFLSALVGIGCCVSRLFGVHGIESGFVFGVTLPWITALTATVLGKSLSPADSLRQAFAVALSCFTIPVVIVGLNQFRVRQCEPGEGFLALCLIGGMSSIMGALIGAYFAHHRRRKTWTIVALLVFLYLGFREFWNTPAIDVYSHVFGWFPGTLYDVGRSIPVALLTLRAFTIVWMIFLCAMVLRRAELRYATSVATFTFAIGIAAFFYGPELDHRVTEDYIQEELGGFRRGEHCEIYFPRELRRERSIRLLEDCDFRAHRAMEMLAVDRNEPVRAYFYRNAEEKQRLMGAGRTFIAKPWRDEVHLQLRGWPHPVLGHEVVHAVAGEAAEGPFSVSGRFGGFFPTALLIEGIAVAIDWRLEDSLTPHQWCRALMELGALPDPIDLDGTGFLRVDPRRAYATAGSLTRYFFETRGAEALQRVHRAGTFDVEVPLEELAAEWRVFLGNEVPLPDGAVERAELRFERSSIFETTCPHRLERLRWELSGDLAAGDDRAALSTCDEMLDIDSGSLEALLARVSASLRLGDFETAEEALGNLEGAPTQVRLMAEERFADSAWRQGRLEDANLRYRALLTEPQSEGERRRREVKVLATTRGGDFAARVFDIFVDQSGGSPSQGAVVDFARDLAALDESGLGVYLVGRQLLSSESYEHASLRFELARLRGLPTEALRREATRNLGLSRVAEGRLDRGAEIWRSARLDPALAAEAQEWLDRISYLRSR